MAISGLWYFIPQRNGVSLHYDPSSEPWEKLIWFDFWRIKGGLNDHLWEWNQPFLWEGHHDLSGAWFAFFCARQVILWSLWWRVVQYTWFIMSHHDSSNSITIDLDLFVWWFLTFHHGKAQFVTSICGIYCSNYRTSKSKFNPWRIPWEDCIFIPTVCLIKISYSCREIIPKTLGPRNHHGNNQGFNPQKYGWNFTQL